MTIINKLGWLRLHSKSPLRIIKNLFLGAFFPTEYRYNIVSRSSKPQGPYAQIPAIAEVFGGVAAYRKTVFDELQFDERLQRFGGYAYNEDSDLAHRVFLHYNRPLLVVNCAPAIHMPDPQDKRVNDMATYYAMMLFNPWLVRENYRKYIPYPAWSFIWRNRIGYVIMQMYNPKNWASFLKGWRMYKKAKKEIQMASQT